MFDNLIQMSFLLQSIVEEQPGNTFSCVCDEAFTLLHTSNDFLSELGFTRKDIQETFNNSFLNLLYEPCREQFLHLVSQRVFPGVVQDAELCFLRKEGDPIWRCIHCRQVIAADGTNMICCSVEDLLISRGELLRPSGIRSDLTSEKQLIVEWDIAHQCLYFPEEWRAMFGYDPPASTLPEERSAILNVHEDDRAALTRMFHELHSGATRCGEIEVRLLRRRNSTYSYVWCKLVTIMQNGVDEMPILGTIFVTDISDEKERMQTLVDSASRDGLTHLLNKAETHKQIEHQLTTRSTACSALLIIDIDNFKHINDVFGHQIGDSILSELSKCLIQQFRVADTLGRIGGDEFMVFMDDIPSSSLAESKAAALLLALNRLPDQLDIDFEFSCSIGIALAPQHGQTFEQLYESADLALYTAKRNGKNTYCIYGGTQAESGASAYSELGAVGSISIAQLSADDGSTNAYVPTPQCQLSYDSDNMERSIRSMLSIIGMQADVSRAYIFETASDGDHFSTSFEWRNSNTPSFLRTSQSLSYSAFGLTPDEICRRNRVLVCGDVRSLPSPLRTSMEAQGVKAVLICFMVDSSGNLLGGIGFSDCAHTREWTKTQVDALTFLSDSIGTFLLNRKHFPGDLLEKR